jgi:hypothetical protein
MSSFVDQPSVTQSHPPADQEAIEDHAQSAEIPTLGEPIREEATPQASQQHFEESAETLHHEEEQPIPAIEEPCSPGLPEASPSSSHPVEPSPTVSTHSESSLKRDPLGEALNTDFDEAVLRTPRASEEPYDAETDSASSFDTSRDTEGE